VFHFDAGWAHGADKLAAALRAGLPDAIQIVSIRAVPPSFHARFSALGKTYVYHLRLGDADPFQRPYVWVVPPNIDLGTMAKAARILRGRHDFKAFSAFNGTERDTTVRTLRRLDVIRRGASVRITAEADGFLYKMVRSLVGALVAVGEGRLTPAQIEGLLGSAVRTPHVITAPPQGLFLERVKYGRGARKARTLGGEGIE
jgi:tRNA pseudouridine38-40 synthase